MKLLIVHLLETAALCSDGVSTHIRGLIEGLRRLGHEPELVSFADVSAARREDYRARVRAAHRVSRGAGVVEIFCRRRDLIRKILETRSRSCRIDVILAQGCLELSAVPPGAPPAVLTLHAFRSDDERRKGHLVDGSEELAWFRTEERTALERATAVIAVSGEYLALARDRGWSGAIGRVVGNGLDIAAYGPGSDLRRELGLDAVRPVLGVLGRLSRQKGHDILLEAFARVLEGHSGAVLLVGGDGELRGELEESARARGLAGAIRWLGEVRDVPAFLRTLDLALLPSRWEGLPYSLLEYGAAGLPVVASGVGGVRELLDHGVNGLLVPPENPEALADAILGMIDDANLRARCGRALRGRIEKRHSLEQMAESYLEAVRSIG